MTISRQELTERVTKIIAEVQKLPAESVLPDATFQQLNIDSLGAIEILFALENDFDITIPEQDAQQMKSVAQAVEALHQLLEKREQLPGSMEGESVNLGGVEGQQ